VVRFSPPLLAWAGWALAVFLVARQFRQRLRNPRPALGERPL
jgi:hypothetical protein